MNNNLANTSSLNSLEIKEQKKQDVLEKIISWKKIDPSDIIWVFSSDELLRMYSRVSALDDNFIFDLESKKNWNVFSLSPYWKSKWNFWNNHEFWWMDDSMDLIKDIQSAVSDKSLLERNLILNPEDNINLLEYRWLKKSRKTIKEISFYIAWLLWIIWISAWIWYLAWSSDESSDKEIDPSSKIIKTIDWNTSDAIQSKIEKVLVIPEETDTEKTEDKETQTEEQEKQKKQELTLSQKAELIIWNIKDSIWEDAKKEDITSFTKLKNMYDGISINILWNTLVTDEEFWVILDNFKKWIWEMIRSWRFKQLEKKWDLNLLENIEIMKTVFKWDSIKESGVEQCKFVKKINNKYKKDVLCKNTNIWSLKYFSKLLWVSLNEKDYK